MKLVILSSSHIGSKTRVVADTIETLAQDHESIKTQLFDLKTLDIPLGDGRLYLDYKGDALKLTTAIIQADALIIVHPIYQASIPSSLKNVFELLPLDAFKDKIIGIVSVAGSDLHYMVPQIQLKPIIEYMKGTVVNPYVFVNDTVVDRQTILDETIITRLNTLLINTEDMYKSMKIIREEKEASLGF